MAGKLPRRTLTTTTKPFQKTYGAGRKGNAFHSLRRFNIARALAKKAGRPGPTKGPKGLPPMGTHRKKF